MADLYINPRLTIPQKELSITTARSSGPGGQNVNKVSTAIHLRFNINRSSLPDFYKQRLLQLNDQRISKDGDIVIKAQGSRSQEQNRIDALERLKTLIKNAVAVKKKRKPTKPTRGSQQRRLESKTKRGRIKALRGKKITE